MAQAPLGRATVSADLRWPFVTAHLLLSMIVLAGAVVLTVEAVRLWRGGDTPFVPVELRRLGLFVVATAFALIVSGTLATAAGPHTGGGTEHVERLGRLEPVLFVHAGVVSAFG